MKRRKSFSSHGKRKPSKHYINNVIGCFYEHCSNRLIQTKRVLTKSSKTLARCIEKNPSMKKNQKF
jgi:hypothetical protein